jgi:hypothetical protein
VGCGVIHVSEIEEWNTIKDLHIKYTYFSNGLLLEYLQQFQLMLVCLLSIQNC